MKDEFNIDSLFSDLNDFPVEFNEAHWKEMELLLKRKKRRRGFFLWFFYGVLALLMVHVFADAFVLNKNPHAYSMSQNTLKHDFSTPGRANVDGLVHHADSAFNPYQFEKAFSSSGFWAKQPQNSNNATESGIESSKTRKVPSAVLSDEFKTSNAGVVSNDEYSARSNSQQQNRNQQAGESEIPAENVLGIAQTEIGQSNSLGSDSIADERDLDFMGILGWKEFELNMEKQMEGESDLPERAIRNKMYLSLNLGPDFVFSNKNSNNIMASNREIRSEQEKNVTRFRIGVNAGMEIKKLDINLGLEMRSLGEHTEYADYTETDSVLVDYGFYEYEDVSYWDYDSIFDGTNWINVDSVYINAIDSTYIENFILEGVENEYNLSVRNGQIKHSLINVPLSIGYRTNIGRIGLTLRQGVNVGLLTRSSGYIVTSNGKDLIRVDDPSLQKRTLLLSSMTSVRFQYFIREELALELVPRVDLPLQSIYKNNGYDRRYTQFSLSFGLSWYLK